MNRYDEPDDLRGGPAWLAVLLAHVIWIIVWVVGGNVMWWFVNLMSKGRR